MNRGKIREERPHDSCEHRGPARRFIEYTPLITSCERILAECSNAEFKDDGVKRSRPIPTKLGSDRTKYYQYHQSHGHLTEDRVHLKDSIETLIKEGRLRQYKRNDAPLRETREVKEIEEYARPYDRCGLL